jgi:hypothetical protein
VIFLLHFHQKVGNSPGFERLSNRPFGTFFSSRGVSVLSTETPDVAATLPTDSPPNEDDAILMAPRKEMAKPLRVAFCHPDLGLGGASSRRC